MDQVTNQMISCKVNSLNNRSQNYSKAKQLGLMAKDKSIFPFFTAFD